MSEPFVTVVIATRDRPKLFRVAADSVLNQTEQAFALIVVNDGSASFHAAEYEAHFEHLGELLGDRLKVCRLEARPRGHGQSYAFNAGVALARTPFVTFLDDDDEWIDAEYLARVRAITAADDADMVMSNQRAWFQGEPISGGIWLSGLEAQLRSQGRSADANGAYEATADDLAGTSGFCHLNVLVVRRALFQQIGGMDEGIRWECDRDLLLRLYDHAGRMLHHPAIVSRHNVPDPAATSNMTTALSMIEKRLFQLRVLDKAALFARHPSIRAHGRLHKGYVLKRMAEELAAARRWRDARWLATQALGASPTIKWAGFTLYCLLRAIMQRDESA